MHDADSCEPTDNKAAMQGTQCAGLNQSTCDQQQQCLFVADVGVINNTSSYHAALCLKLIGAVRLNDLAYGQYRWCTSSDVYKFCKEVGDYVI